MIEVSMENNRHIKGLLLADVYQQDESFYCIKLNEYLNNTNVRNIYFAKQVIMNINEFVFKELKNREHREIDEIGGFLLGKFFKCSADQFDIGIEIFCPAEEGVQKSPIQIEIGTEANIVLDQVMDTYPQLCLIGWFHTHPGYSPYLSKIDLACNHELFYLKPYQVAIVLDPLTEYFDTGLFSRKQDGSMNNKVDFTKWVHWKNLIY